jgi:hypothetical protein
MSVSIILGATHECNIELYSVHRPLLRSKVLYTFEALLAAT